MSQELVNSLISQVEQHIHGAARDQTVQEIQQNPTADTIAKIAYATIMAMSKQSTDAGSGLNPDVLLAVATETIDMLIEIAEAIGVTVNVEEMREESLLKLVILHGQAVEGDPEEQAAAQQMLAVLSGDGTMEQSMNHINKRADASPEQMQAAGQQMAAPKQNPVSAGVQQGLMQQ